MHARVFSSEFCCWHSLHVTAFCWNVVITSWSRYLYLCTRDLGLHRVACVFSLFPSVHIFYSDWGVSQLAFYYTYSILIVLRLHSGTQSESTYSTVTEGLHSGFNKIKGAEMSRTFKIERRQVNCMKCPVSLYSQILSYPMQSWVVALCVVEWSAVDR